MRSLLARVGVVVAVAAALLIPALPAYAFSDVPANYWDYDAIMYVADENTWMQDYGLTEFKPTTLETRKLLARTLVTIYAPDEPIDPSITFPDLPASDPFYPYANVAVKLGWILPYASGKWAPNDPVRFSLLDRSLIRAIGLTEAIDGLANIHQEDGTKYTVEERFPEMQLARWLDLHYNHGDETKDLQQEAYVPRDEMAYTLWKATTLEQWQLGGTVIFNDITLPTVTDVQEDFTQYMITEIGYPYIWGGEWRTATGAGYCCGTQPQGGMDCSGFVWWTLKKNESNYNAAQFHPAYGGWHIAERASYYMAKGAPVHKTYPQLVPGNLMFFASNGGNNWDDVDHVSIYLGNDWMVQSTSGGPQLEWVGSGWYFDHFVWGRQLTSKAPDGRMMRVVDDPSAGEPAIRPPAGVVRIEPEN